MTKDHYLIALSESTQTDFGREDFADQSEDQRVFSAIWGLESQVNNGGFLQFFASGDGEMANDTPKALRAIHADGCAAIVENALRTVSANPLPASQEVREAIIENLNEDVVAAVDELDESFMAYPDDLSELLYAFVAARPETFGPITADIDD